MGEGRAIAVVLRDLLPPAEPRSLLPMRALVDLAVLADRLSYHSVWVPEGRGRELGSMLGAMAQATARLGLASGILPLYSRPPGERVSVRGRVFTVEAFELEARPDHPVPIYVAALGPAMLRLAGEVADGVILNWTSPERVPWAVARVREGAVRAGRDPASVQVVCFVRAAVTDDAFAAWGVLRRLVATYAAMPSYARMFAQAGHAAAIEAMRAAWQAGGVDAAAAALSDEFVQGLGVVGGAPACRDGLRRYAEAGVDVVAAYPFPVGPDPAGSMRRTIEALAPMP